jgi:peptidoglycan/LPS O-acetylase OafA/YrhL
MSRIETTQPLLRSRMPELDTLRGIAVLMVIFFHGFYFVTGTARFHGLIRWFVIATGIGWVGVNLFFVLSGFLITGILLGSRDNPGYYRGFYFRRALRILPAYYGLLLLLLITVRAGLVERQVSLGFLALCFVYLSNMTSFFGVPMQYAALWSLAVEEHFYLLWPAVVRNLSRRFLLWACGLIILGSPALRAFYFWRHYQYGAAYTWLVADGLAWGALIALLARGRLSSRRAMLRFGVACLVGTACLVTALLPFDLVHSGSLAGGVLLTSLINSFFAGVLTLALVMGSGSWKFIFARPGLKFFGEISYGLYLVQMLAFDGVSRALGHWGLNVSRTSGSFALVLARFAAGTALAIGVAYFSRWYLEEPFLRLKDKFEVGRNKIPVKVLEDRSIERKAAS